MDQVVEQLGVSIQDNSKFSQFENDKFNEQINLMKKEIKSLKEMDIADLVGEA